MCAEFNMVMNSEDSSRFEVSELSEFIENQLYFMTLSNSKESSTVQSFKDWKKSTNNEETFYFNVESKLMYESFYYDFGPLNLAMIYRYVQILRDKLKKFKKVIHCVHRIDPENRSNAAFLICAFMIIEHNWTAHQAYTILSQKHKFQYVPFRDATKLVDSKYFITIEECVNALYKAKWFGFFNFADFNLDEYEEYEIVANGDMNWIIPGTLLAFATPYSKTYIEKTTYPLHSPDHFYGYFKKNNVKHVVRLNSENTYNAKSTFVAIANIQHTDLFFADGSPPPMSILHQFLNLCEHYQDENCEDECTSNNISDSNALNITNQSSVAKHVGAVAVHCKAGLGRTGSLVASYVVKHWCFTANEAVAWLRICRPGSVNGVQQHWLNYKEPYLKFLGKHWRHTKMHDVNKYKRFTKGIYCVKKQISNTSAYQYVDPPCKSHISYLPKHSSCDSRDNKNIIIESEKIDECNKDEHSFGLKEKLQNNRNMKTNDQKSILKRRRSASENNDSVFKNTPLITKKRRLQSNTDVNIKENNLSIENNRSVRATTLTPNETTINVTAESKLSYDTLATTSSSDCNKNCNITEKNNEHIDN